MCVSMAPARFSGTTLYVGRRHHPTHGLIHVLGYQNSAANLHDGPNAMLLHLPSAQPVTPDNFISAGKSDKILSRMVDALRPVAPAAPGGMDWMGGAPRSAAVRVFDHDVYTVLLAEDATLIPAAISRVPRRRRPRLDPALMEFYAAHYPHHTIAVCCFDNVQARRAKPLLLWYHPLDDQLLTAPALDCHTGGPPDLTADVPVDHWVILGTDEAPADWGVPVTYP
ncbi:hypothetical protein GL263_26190, partial [Streptomyces durbertensis]